MNLLDESLRREPPLNEQSALRRAEELLRTIPPYPIDRYIGRGIVICGGGERYLPCAWVCIRMLRHLGCALPIELWHLRRSEGDARVSTQLAALNVRCVDAAEVRRRCPARYLGGWELKPYAILHSSFEQVLYLDADNVPVRDPGYLFDARPFDETGAVYWPDYGRLPATADIWRIVGVPYRDEPEFESGQMDELAAILATGARRLLALRTNPAPGHVEPAAEPPHMQLALSAQTSVTVPRG